MKRVSVAPRDDYVEKAHRSGVFAVQRKLQNGELHYTWDETSAYLIERDEVDLILDAVAPIVSMSYEAIDFLLDGEWGTLGLPRPFFEFARNSFDDQNPQLFTRYDFAYLGNGEIKLVGIDSDSPRTIMEASQAQRKWLWDKFESRARNRQITQLNSIQEITEKAFAHMRKQSDNSFMNIVRGSDNRGEDWITSSFIKGIANKAGWKTEDTRIKDLKWDNDQMMWIDSQGKPLLNIYKHFPWDMLLRQKVTKDLIINHNRLNMLFEPSWKTILSSRAMLPALYDLYPNSSILSPAFMEKDNELGNDIVTSTVLPSTSRNEMGLLKGRAFTSWGEGMKDMEKQKNLVYRKLEIPKRYKDKNGGNRFTYLSIYTVAGKIAGLGMRETRMPLLGANSTFRPHLVKL